MAALICVQMDRILLSRWLPLDEFGYYTLALTVASVSQLFYQPIGAALFPVFSQKAALGEEASVPQLYHQGCQWIAVTAIPTAMFCALFAPELLDLWTRDPVVVRNTRWLVLVLMGNATVGASARAGCSPGPLPAVLRCTRARAAA